MYVPAITGPRAAPIRLKSAVIPIDILMRCLGERVRTILRPPTCANESPVATMLKDVASKKSVECNASNREKPIVEITVPAIVGLTFPNLDKMKPEMGAKTRDIIVKES